MHRSIEADFRKNILSCVSCFLREDSWVVLAWAMSVSPALQVCCRGWSTVCPNASRKTGIAPSNMSLSNVLMNQAVATCLGTVDSLGLSRTASEVQKSFSTSLLYLSTSASRRVLSTSLHTFVCACPRHVHANMATSLLEKVTESKPKTESRNADRRSQLRRAVGNSSSRPRAETST